MRKRIIVLILILSLLIVGVQAVDPQISCNSMTSNTTSSACATGYIVNVSAMLDVTSYNGWKAFDGTTDFWGAPASVTQWIWQSIPAPKILTSYSIKSYSDPQYAPNTWTLKGSNTGKPADETVLDTQTGITWTGGDTKSYTVSNTAAFTYYNISVSANNGGVNTVIDEITLYGLGIPIASFTVNATTGIAPTAILLTDNSTGSPTSRVWGARNLTPGNNTWFSLGTTTPLSTVLGVGNWSARVNATNAVGTNTSTQVTWVNVSGISTPTVTFTTNVTSGVNPLALYLNDTSTQSPTYWNTSWGDTATSWTNQTTFPVTNITHVYSTAGNYWIIQYATNAYGTANGTPLLITVYGTAYSDFSAWNTAGNAPHTTYLYDTSTNTTPGAATYYWDLGDGNTSTSQNLYYTWNITGTYSVNHSMNNGLSTSWMNKSNYVTVGTAAIAPVASFYGGPQLGAPPLQVFFTDVSTNTPTSWLWTFGDGTTSTSQNPTKWYNVSGFFTVNLTATNTAGSNKTSQSNFVMVY